MINRTRKIWAVALAASLLAVPIATRAQVSLDITVAPPPPRHEVPPPPRRGQVWAPGHWNYQGGHHVWVAGHWMPERPGYRWEPDAWTQRGQQWHYEPGHWVR
jgi:WXXGXW repeat (2 copies)